MSEGSLSVAVTLAIIIGWVAFSVGFLAGILWAAHCERRRIRQNIWQVRYNISREGKLSDSKRSFGHEHWG